MSNPNSSRLMNKPMTVSCNHSDLQKQMVLCAKRAIANVGVAWLGRNATFHPLRLQGLATGSTQLWYWLNPIGPSKLHSLL
jgi:hypothetical protein